MIIENKSAEELLNQARALDDEGKEDEAITLYNILIERYPDWATPYYNLGLIYKYNSEWFLSFKNNKKATELDADSEPAWWNLGIAATAIGDWETARKAWNFFGLELDINNNEPNMDLGITPIRLNAEGNAEVVWAKRIDPARSIITSIPLPESNHRYNDMVLNDGAPVGERICGGKKYNVFNELQLIIPSKFKTYSVDLFTNSASHVDILENLCDNDGIAFENWTTSIRILCRQCSEGTPHEHHDNDNVETDNDTRRIAFASIEINSIKKILANWKIITLCEYDSLKLELE